MKIANVEIGPDQPCRFVAELSNNHNGDRDRCGRLIDAAQAAGADVVKFQCYSPDELVALRGDGPAPEPWGSQGWSMRDLYAKARTPFDWFPKIRDHCERVGMPWFSSVFGEESLAVLQSVGCPAYKIARLDNQSDPLANLLLDGIPPILTSADWGEPFTCADLLLYCPPGYPALDVELPDRFGDDQHFQGFSYHQTDPALAVEAARRGAYLIEMHLMLADEPSELESHVSLTEHQFAEMVAVVRARELLG